MFSNARTGVNIDSIKTGWRNACDKAGLVNLRFHDTRHTFATRLRANGVHEWDIRDLLGHASVRMTSVYTHQTPANLCKAVTALAQTKTGKVVKFERNPTRKVRSRSALIAGEDACAPRIAPSSRHRLIKERSGEDHEELSSRTVAV